MESNSDLFSDADSLHEAGKFPEAESAYREIISRHPDHPAAWTRLGDVLSDSGKPSEAEVCYSKVIQARPDSPDSADAYDGVAAILQNAGKIDAAIGATRRSIELRFDANGAYVLGRQLQQMNRVDQAIDAFQLATTLNPKFAEAHAQIGALYLALNRPEDAQRSYRAAIDARPTLAEAHCNLAQALFTTGEETEALTSAREAIKLKPDLAEAHNLLGAILKSRRRPADALLSFDKAIQLKPDYADAMNNGATVMQELGRFADAGRFYEMAIQKQPQAAHYHENLAYNLLIRGDYPRGFAEFEWRRANPQNLASRRFPRPQWDGSNLQGKVILLHTEKSVGDVVQFARYIPMVRDRGGRVIVECPQPLAAFMQSIDGVSEITEQGKPVPAFDYHSPLLTLPLLFGTTVETIPNKTPYIKIDPGRAAKIQTNLTARTGKKRVGIIWAHKDDRNRSLSPQILEPLAEVENIEWISLQKNAKHSLPAKFKPADLSQHLLDLADVAALVAELDLLIAIDSGPVHIAGALNKPVWVMLPFVPHWRWLTGRDDSPWYPSARLFRQETAGDWAGVVKRIREALEN